MMNRCYIDHLAITAPTLEIGANYVFESLGVYPQDGGKHQKMGTHNLLLRLGDAVYLEVIAIDPDAPAPERSRWFALDNIDSNSKPVLATWVARTQDIYSSVKEYSENIGSVEAMDRGNFSWLITIPEDGELKQGGAAPALIQWQTPNHPAEGLQDFGLTLIALELYHHEPRQVHAMLDSIYFEGPVSVKGADSSVQPYLKAIIETPGGVRQLA